MELYFEINFSTCADLNPALNLLSTFMLSCRYECHRVVGFWSSPPVTWWKFSNHFCLDIWVCYTHTNRVYCTSFENHQLTHRQKEWTLSRSQRITSNLGANTPKWFYQCLKDLWSWKLCRKLARLWEFRPFYDEGIPSTAKAAPYSNWAKAKLNRFYGHIVFHFHIQHLHPSLS